MNLHLRVLIGYHLLVALLVICAAGAALTFRQQESALEDSRKLAQGLRTQVLQMGDAVAASSPLPGQTGSARAELEKGLKELGDQVAAEAGTASRYAAVYWSLLVVVLITVAFLSRQLHRGLLDRLVATATVAQAASEGDRSRRVNSGPEDELGIIGRQLNVLLDTEQALHAEMEGRLCQQRQLLLGMANSWPKKLALFTIYGDLAVSTLEEKTREEIDAAEVKFPDPPTWPADDKPFDTKAAGHELHCQLLRVDGRRPVGWLAEIG